MREHEPGSDPSASADEDAFVLALRSAADAVHQLPAALDAALETMQEVARLAVAAEPPDAGAPAGGPSPSSEAEPTETAKG